MQVTGSSPEPTFARLLSVDRSLSGEDVLWSTVLPEELLISILADRLLVSNVF